MRYQAEVFSANTKKTYTTHMNAYLNFCAKFGFTPVPASTDMLCKYVVMLTKTLKYSSIKQYLNIVRLLHLRQGLPNPLQNNFQLDCTLRGIRRVHGDTVIHMQPITPDILRQIYGTLNMGNPRHACIWSAALTMFFALLRRSNVLPTHAKTMSGENCLLRQDVLFHNWGMTLLIRKTKTIQFKERSLRIPVPKMQDHDILCPVQAMFHAMQLNTDIGDTGYIYVLPNGKPVIIAEFVKQIRDSLQQLQLPAELFCGHSFRRGGASWAHNTGVNVETIRQLGDWQSSAYTNYIYTDSKNLFQAISQMQNSC